MDFTRSTAIGERIDADFAPLQIEAGYDHCWVLKNENKVKLAARLEDPKSGRVMEILTNQPGVQLYTANYFDGSLAGKGGVCYTRQSALCLETQNFPDTPNKPHFPSCVLRPNETYKHTLIHKFSTK
jgi:aldose 1-epimerase